MSIGEHPDELHESSSFSEAQKATPLEEVKVEIHTIWPSIQEALVVEAQAPLPVTCVPSALALKRMEA